MVLVPCGAREQRVGAKDVLERRALSHALGVALRILRPELQPVGGELLARRVRAELGDLLEHIPHVLHLGSGQAQHLSAASRQEVAAAQAEWLP